MKASGMEEYAKQQPAAAPPSMVGVPLRIVVIKATRNLAIQIQILTLVCGAWCW